MDYDSCHDSRLCHRRLSRFLPAVGVFTIALLCASAASPENHHTLLAPFIDRGQGSAVLIQTAGKNILYDCGDTGQGKVVLDYLKDQDVKHIDVLIASRAHKDHIGGGA